MKTPTDNEPKCECFFTDPKYWTRLGSAVEPGSQMEWNPDCPAHGEAFKSGADWRDAEWAD